MELFVLTAIGTVIGSIAAVEASAWVPHLSRRVLRSALSRLSRDLPPDVRARWTDEIEADFACFSDRPWGGLAFALGVRGKGARRLAGELEPRRLRVSVSRRRRRAGRTPIEYRVVQSFKVFPGATGNGMPRYIRIPIYEEEVEEDG